MNNFIKLSNISKSFTHQKNLRVLKKLTYNFKLGVFAATGGIFILYFINLIMSFFTSGLSIMNINNASMFSIGFSVFVGIIASLNLVLDFDFIEEGAEKGAPPKQLEKNESYEEPRALPSARAASVRVHTCMRLCACACVCIRVRGRARCASVHLRIVYRI